MMIWCGIAAVLCIFAILSAKGAWMKLPAGAKVVTGAVLVAVAVGIVIIEG